MAAFYSQDLLDRELDDFDMEMGPETTDDSSKLKLHQASRRGDLEEVKRLTEEKHLNPLQKEGKYGRNI